MESEPQPDDRPRKNRRLRFSVSIRGLMILVLATGSWLGWYGLKVREQRKVVEAIHQAGGEVGYDWQIAKTSNLNDLDESIDIDPKVTARRIGWPNWLIRLLGIDAFGRVDKVWFAKSQTEISEPLFAEIGKLRDLEVLCIHRKPALDTAGLAHLRSLSKLRVVDLQVRPKPGQSVDLAWLRRKTNLEMLHLGSLPVQDKDLIHLRDLTKLQTLVLASPEITDAGLVHLSGLTRVECLILKYASVRGEGLAHLGRMQSLETLAMLRSKLESLNDLPTLPITNLCLPFTSIDDQGLARIRLLPRLDEVYLDGTNITDVGLQSLVNQPNIRFVHVNGTIVTPAGADAFEKRKPHAKVFQGPKRGSAYFAIR